MNDLIVNVALESLYIHEVGGKRLTIMPTIAAVDNVIETSCKTYDGKKQEVSHKVMRASVVGYKIPLYVLYARYIRYVRYSLCTSRTLCTEFRYMTFGYQSSLYNLISSNVAHATFTNSLSSALSSCVTCSIKLFIINIL